MCIRSFYIIKLHQNKLTQQSKLRPNTSCCTIVTYTTIISNFVTTACEKPHLKSRLRPPPEPPIGPHGGKRGTVTRWKKFKSHSSSSSSSSSFNTKVVKTQLIQSTEITKKRSNQRVNMSQYSRQSGSYCTRPIQSRRRRFQRDKIEVEQHVSYFPMLAPLVCW